MVEQATHVFSYLRGESPFLTRSQCSIEQFWFLCIQKDLSFQTSCNLKDNIIAFKSLSPSGLHVVFLTLIPYSFHLFKGLVCFGNVLSAKFCHLEGNMTTSRRFKCVPTFRGSLSIHYSCYCLDSLPIHRCSRQISLGKVRQL